MVSLNGNHYEVDPALVGRRVQLVFDPFDLEHLEVRYDHRRFGVAIPHRLSVHVHPKATAEAPDTLDGMASTPQGSTTSPSSRPNTKRRPAGPSTSLSSRLPTAATRPAATTTWRSRDDHRQAPRPLRPDSHPLLP
jgi:hypothetical protein